MGGLAGLRRGALQVAFGQAVALEHLLEHVDIGGQVNVVAVKVLQQALAYVDDRVQRVPMPARVLCLRAR